MYLILSEYSVMGKKKSVKLMELKNIYALEKMSNHVEISECFWEFSITSVGVDNTLLHFW